MKITMYELLGMIKDDNAPKKIMFLGNTYKYDETDKTYRTIIGNTNIGEVHCLEFYLDYEVEILEEEKKIPEKLEETSNIGDLTITYPSNKELMKKINEIIDYLKSKGE